MARRMQIHQHQPPSRLQQAQALPQYKLPLLSRKFMQCHAQLNGEEAFILQRRILGQSLHPPEAWVSSRGQRERQW